MESLGFTMKDLKRNHEDLRALLDRVKVVPHQANDRILRFDGQSGEFRDTFVPAGSGGLNIPVGLDFGPDGNLYYADNQYFYDKNFKSRLIRVVMEDGEPVRAEVAVDGMKATVLHLPREVDPLWVELRLPRPKRSAIDELRELYVRGRQGANDRAAAFP